MFVVNGRSRIEIVKSLAAEVPVQSSREDYKQLRIVALIPAYNEAGHVGEVVRRTLAYVDEVIVIDDGSTDATAAVAKEAGAVVLDNIVNRGLGRSMRRGYQAALERGAEVVVQLDADGQYDPAQIPRLVEPILRREADMVLGARLDNLRYDMPLLKRAGNEAFSWVLRNMTKQEVRDGQTGFRAMRREVLETCLPINRFSYTQEMILRAAAEGWRVKSVPIEFHERYDGKSRLFRHPLVFAMRQWGIIIRTIRDYYPMKFFGFTGAAFLLMGLVALSVALAHYLQAGVIEGRLGTAILGVFLTLVGLQLVFLGLVADMIRTHTKY
jgi:glycosyltransferase involved in cell wall biosynthesis